MRSVTATKYVVSRTLEAPTPGRTRTCCAALVRSLHAAGLTEFELVSSVPTTTRVIIVHYRRAVTR